MSKRKGVVFYHKSDLDGWCSAAITAYYLKTNSDMEIVLYGVQYGDALPKELLSSEDFVYVVDFVFSEEEMLFLKNGYVFTWVDHHKSSIEKFEKWDIPGKRSEKEAACELVWRFFFPRKRMPYLVKALGVYDTWRFTPEEKEEIFEIQYGTRFYAPDPGDENGLGWWFGALFNDEEYENSASSMLNIKLAGEVLYENARRGAKSLVKNCFMSELDGKKVIALNAYDNLLPEQIEKLINENPEHPFSLAEFLVMFRFIGDRFVCNLRQIKKPGVDLSNIALKFGGGGHRNASGFTVNVGDVNNFFDRFIYKEVENV